VTEARAALLFWVRAWTPYSFIHMVQNSWWTCCLSCLPRRWRREVVLNVVTHEIIAGTPQTVVSAVRTSSLTQRLHSQ